MRNAALTLCSAGLFLVGILNVAALPAATGADAQTAAPDVARAANCAQAAIKARHWREARAILERAEDLDLTAADRYLFDRLRAYVLFEEHEPLEAAAAYAQLLRSPFSSPAMRASRTKAVAELYFQAGDYRGAARYGEQYLRLRPDEMQTAALVADSYLRLDDYSRAAAMADNLLDRAEADHEVPRESWLRIGENAYFRMDDVPHETRMLQALVRYYHRTEDWQALITASARGLKNERLEFGYLRLQYDLGLLRDPDQYEALIFGYSGDGMPARAAAVLAQAEAQGMFSSDRSERLQHAIEVQGRDPQQRLRRALAEAQHDSTGESNALAGRIYLGEARYDRAIASFQTALQKGGLRDEDAIRIDLGIAALRNHQPAMARAAFDQVTARSGWSTLATLWSLRLGARSPALVS